MCMPWLLCNTPLIGISVYHLALQLDSTNVPHPETANAYFLPTDTMVAQFTPPDLHMKRARAEHIACFS